MQVNEELRAKIKELSILARKVYGIAPKADISFQRHPEFVTCVIRDITNIAYNLAIADHISSQEEKQFLLYTLKEIFYPERGVSAAFLKSMGKQFESFNHPAPEIKSPIYILEQSKHYDKQFNTKITPQLRDSIIAFGDAMVMVDGFESIREFDVMETFRMWIEGIE